MLYSFNETQQFRELLTAEGPRIGALGTALVHLNATNPSRCDIISPIGTMYGLLMDDNSMTRDDMHPTWYTALCYAVEIIEPGYVIHYFDKKEKAANKVKPNFAYGEIKGAKIKIYGQSDALDVRLILIHPDQCEDRSTRDSFRENQFLYNTRFQRALINAHGCVQDSARESMRDASYLRPRPFSRNNQYADITEKERYANRTREFDNRPRSSRGPTLAPIINRVGGYASENNDSNASIVNSLFTHTTPAPLTSHSTYSPIVTPTLNPHLTYSPTFAHAAPASPTPSVDGSDWLGFDNDAHLKYMSAFYLADRATVEEITPIKSLLSAEAAVFYPSESSDMAMSDSSLGLGILEEGLPVVLDTPAGLVSRLPPRPKATHEAPVIGSSKMHSDYIANAKTQAALDKSAKELDTPVLATIPEVEIDSVVPDIIVEDDPLARIDAEIDFWKNRSTNYTLNAIDLAFPGHPTTSSLKPLSSLDSGEALSEIARYVEATRYALRPLPSFTPQNSPTEILYGSQIERLGRLSSARTSSSITYADIADEPSKGPSPTFPTIPIIRTTPTLPTTLAIPTNSTPPTISTIPTIPITPVSKGKEVERPHKITTGFPPGLGFPKLVPEKFRDKFSDSYAHPDRKTAPIVRARNLAEEFWALDVDNPSPTFHYGQLLPPCAVESGLSSSLVFQGNILVGSGNIEYIGERDSSVEFVEDSEPEDGEIRGRSPNVRGTGSKAGDSLGAMNTH
ncbi:hypothetical protein P7C70_g8741, partial [Phenoliferia sp. Uapishka_3]